ncbi:MAG: hypothetical protein NC935_05680 [Candidatus Omnitrophica bacterium]|nr:hypothetical protein [Candidatus Omnitrophota bacterium]
MKKFFIFLIFAIFNILVYSQQQETLTITTYYPAPVGVYNQLVTRTLGVGDNNNDEQITALDAPNFNTNPGDVWIAGNVGIGTTNPQARLDVSGEVRVGSTGVGCNANLAGAMRYNNNQIEYCNGNNWMAAFPSNLVTGTYRGNGSTQKISLGFRPRAIQIYTWNGKTGATSDAWGFFKTSDMKEKGAFRIGFIAWTFSGAVSIENDGFTVYYFNDVFGRTPNTKDYYYYYVAWQ